MTVYVYPNLKTKKSVKEAIQRGEELTCKRQTPWGEEEIIEGRHCVSGPHFPKAHKWYGVVEVEDGKVIRIK